jgi:hypothetical protein
MPSMPRILVAMFSILTPSQLGGEILRRSVEIVVRLRLLGVIVSGGEWSVLARMRREE